MPRPPLRQGDKLPAWFYQRKTEVVARMPRIGVDYAGAAAKWPLRFFLQASPHVSRKEKAWKEKARLTKRSGRNS